MLVGIIKCGPRQTILTEQIIVLEKIGCERFHIVDGLSDLDSLRQTLTPGDLVIEADSDRRIREIRLH